MHAGCFAGMNDDRLFHDSEFVLFASACDALLCP